MLSESTATLLGALIGFIGGLVVARYQYRQKSDELFFKALDFLKGKTQARNLGIAAIELYWANRRHRALCTSLLVGTAIYLLLESNQRAKAHELNNLCRVMQLLLSDPKTLESNIEQRKALSGAVATAMRGHPTGVLVPEDTLKQWASRLSG